ncbi:MAG: hypothetical protein ABI741_11920 [Ferruginibacter sp.]
MTKPVLLYFLLLFFNGIISDPLSAQNKPVNEDTFFLAKKKGLLGKLGKSLVTSAEAEPVKIAYPYLKYNGRTVRNIDVFAFGINQRLDDTSIVKESFISRAGNKLHANTRATVVKKNLFFKEGDKFLPLLVSDNERFLRDQNFLGDALIVVLEASEDSVDIIVLTRDVFSIGGSINIGTNKIRAEIREENLAGSGNQFSISGIYDKERTPQIGAGAELILKNINGTFLNWYTGFKSFNKTFNMGRFEENYYYTRVEKPLLNRYTQWTGSVEVDYHKTINGYSPDSVYLSDSKYMYSNLDVWGGYNIGYRNKKGRDSEKRLRHFVAARSFYHYFDKVPKIVDTSYNSGYANINGLLFSYTLYKQNFYRTNFIYGFGRNEDVPIGLSASLIAGWTNKQNMRRPYYAVEFEGTRFSRKKIFSDYKFRVGGYYEKGKFQDIDLLAGIDHFTRLKKFRPKWLNRNFISFSFSKQINSILSEPLFLRSDFGLPYFANGEIYADQRVTLKLESVFYNLDKVLGFRFAPFVFGDISLLKPLGKPSGKTDGFSAIGGGVRTRNENLVFGTIELKGYFFPRTTDGMKNWKIEVMTKLRFRFNNTFIKKPDFIVAN